VSDTKRRLIVLLDGTWNEDESYDEDTNVVRLRNIIANGISDEFYVRRSIEEVNQSDSPAMEIGAKRYLDFDYLVFYERGVGTGPGLDRVTGGALGWGLEGNIRRAYKFLCRYYVSGSEIFIFGFSRGSYTARSLVGYLGSAGLLTAEHCTPELEQQAWSYYRTSPNDRLPGTWKQLQKYVHSIGELRVACLGLFDTVGALGIPTSIFRRLNRQNYEFHDVELSPIVKLNLHALAIDERRKPFEASVWRQSRFKVSNSVTEQTWFTGVHADIGGGYFHSRERQISEARALDDISLDWMLKRIRFHYPDFPILDEAFPQMRGSLGKLGLQHESRTLKYRFSKPVVRSIGNLISPVLANEVAAGYDRDGIAVGESIHVSALERLARKAPMIRSGVEGLYLPRNVIENIPDLYERYCRTQSRHWSPDATSITSWAGEVVDPQSSKEDALEEVRIALKAACDRLKSLGYDVLSPDWNSQEAAQSLAAAAGARSMMWGGLGNSTP